jgi:hypothetical protein
MRQASRCFAVHDGTATMKQLREWAYPDQRPQRWMSYSMRRALRKLGAVKIGRARGVGCPAIYRLSPTT